VCNDQLHLRTVCIGLIVDCMKVAWALLIEAIDRWQAQAATAALLLLLWHVSALCSWLLCECSLLMATGSG